MNLNYFSVCCIAFNEQPYIKEWVIHHLLVGAEKIIIFDNESDPPLEQSLREFVDNNLVIIHSIKGKEKQIPAYHHCLKTYGPSTKWIAFIDVDEFLIPKACNDIRLILTDYEDYGGLGVHWVEFGSSGYINRPNNSQLKTYIHRFPLDFAKNLHIKSIVQPERVLDTYNPHKFIYKEPWYCVDENFFPIAESQAPFTANKIQLNHYYYRSQKDYSYKVERGRADRADEAGRRKYDPFYNQLKRAIIYDNIGLNFSSSAEKFFQDEYKLIEKINKSNNERKSIEEYIDIILHYISRNKTNYAKTLIKKLIVSIVDKKIIIFLLLKVYIKENDFFMANKIFKKYLSMEVDPYICVDYVYMQIQNENYQEAYNLILYIKWRFANLLQKDQQLSKNIDNYFDQAKSFYNHVQGIN
jgi:hypothetical protein